MQPTLPSVCWVRSDQQTTEGAPAPPHRQVEALCWEPGQAGPEDISTLHVAHTANLCSRYKATLPSAHTYDLMGSSF